jgi:hypothetical protein
LKFLPSSLSAALCAALLAVSPALSAQVTATAAPAAVNTGGVHDVEIFGGAAYAHANPGFAHQVQATNLLGWTGGADYWFSRHVAVEGYARGVYGSFTIPVNNYLITGSSNISEYSFLFGPSFRLHNGDKWQAGIHVDIGGVYGTFSSGYANTGVQPSATGVFNDQLAFTGAFGGWAQRVITPSFSVRVVADYQPTRFSGRGQNEFAGSASIVYHPHHSR